MTVLLHKWEFKSIEVEFLKVSAKFDHQDFQILELGNPGTSWFRQLVQALWRNIKEKYQYISVEKKKTTKQNKTKKTHLIWSYEFLWHCGSNNFIW